MTLVCVYIYIYIYIYREREIYIHIYSLALHTGRCEKNTPPEKKTCGKNWLSEHQIKGRIAVSAAGLHGKGSHRRSAL